MVISNKLRPGDGIRVVGYEIDELDIASYVLMPSHVIRIRDEDGKSQVLHCVLS